MIPLRAHRGVTLIELVVALTLLGFAAGVVGLNMRSVNWLRPDRAIVGIVAVRQSAIDLGRPMTVTVIVRGKPYAVTARPDGSIIADESLGIDRLDGTNHVDSWRSGGPGAF